MSINAYFSITGAIIITLDTSFITIIFTTWQAYCITRLYDFRLIITTPYFKIYSAS